MVDCPQVVPGPSSLRPRADSLSGEARSLQGGLDRGQRDIHTANIYSPGERRIR